MEYGTGAIMAVPAHDERDFAFARQHGLPVRVVIQPPGGDADRPRRDDRGGAARGRHGQQRSVRRRAVACLDREGRGVARRGRPRRGHGELPAARLAAEPPAVLGRADPDRALPGVRRGRRARRPAAGAAARRRRLPAGRGVAPGPPPHVEARRLPVVRRRGHARHRHDGHVRRLELVPVPLLLAGLRGRPVPPRGRRPLDARRPVHRRRRARDPAPALHALLHEGALRPGHGRVHRAVPEADEPGPGDLRRRVDERSRRATSSSRCRSWSAGAPTRCA